ncbi:MAG: ATP-binding cassette domain-containing protein [Thermomicrobiales bacterium]
MAIVTVDNVTHTFKGTVALDHLSCEISDGITGLVGPNGAGKTTIMRLLATIYTLQQGEITLLGTSFRDDAGRRAAQSRTGYLPQSFGFYPNFTVKEFVEYFAILHGVSHPEIDPAVMNALERVDLVSRAKQKMRSLSGG